MLIQDNNISIDRVLRNDIVIAKNKMSRNIIDYINVIKICDVIWNCSAHSLNTGRYLATYTLDPWIQISNKNIISKVVDVCIAYHAVLIDMLNVKN
jgi:hypothetical protein